MPPKPSNSPAGAGPDPQQRIIKREIFQIKPMPYIIGVKDGGQEVEAQVEVTKDGDRVTGITVSCPCGRVTQIECE